MIGKVEDSKFDWTDMRTQVVASKAAIKASTVALAAEAASKVATAVEEVGSVEVLSEVTIRPLASVYAEGILLEEAATTVAAVLAIKAARKNLLHPTLSLTLPPAAASEAD